MTESISGSTEIYGLIGDPVGHSYSPRMMNAAFSSMNLDARYLAFQVKEEEVSEAIEGLSLIHISEPTRPLYIS